MITMQWIRCSYAETCKRLTPKWRWYFVSLSIWIAVIAQLSASQIKCDYGPVELLLFIIAAVVLQPSVCPPPSLTSELNLISILSLLDSALLTELESAGSARQDTSHNVDSCLFSLWKVREKVEASHVFLRLSALWKVSKLNTFLLILLSYSLLSDAKYYRLE